MKIAVAHKLELFDGLGERPADALVLPVKVEAAAMGESVAGFLERAGWRFDLPTICLINGECYARAEWAERRLGMNDNVEFVTRPAGGGGASGGGASASKSIMGIVGLLALTVLAPYAVGAIGLTGAFASIGSSLLIAGGALLISHFLQPKTTGKSSSDPELYSFAFQANQAKPMQVIPVGYGRVLNTPDLASPSYSEYSGDAMVEYGLYCIGAGNYEPEELRIDDTTIWTSGGGFDPSFPGITMQWIRPGEQVALFPANVVSASEVSGSELGTEFTAGFTINAAQTEAVELMVDLVFPSGTYVTYKERVLPTPVQVLFEARLIDNAGAPLGGWFTAFTQTYNFRKQSQIRLTERITVGPGRYELRARRVNPTITGQQLFNNTVSGVDTVQWTAARARINGPNTFPGVTLLAVRAEANSALNGITNGRLRVISTRILPVWNGSGFVDQPTRSIAWAALDAWRNADYSAGLSLTQVDFQSFYAYDQLWAGRDDTFDYFFTQADSLDNILETILKAGMAMPAFIGDRLTIVREEPRGIPRMMFNDFNIIQNSLQIDYVIADSTFADGVSGQYLDESSWRLADITSAPNGALLDKPAQIEVTGVVKRRQAAEIVRFHAAESQYRRITVTWQTGLEGKLLKRGDLVHVNTEQPEDWGQSREVIATNEQAFRVQLNPAPEWDETQLTHYVQFQRRDGSPWGPVRCSKASGDASWVVLNPNDVAAEEARQGMSVWDAIARSDVMERPPVDFSPGQPRSFPVLITEGDADEDGEHITLKGVQDAAEVYNIDGVTGVPPLATIPNIMTSQLPTVATIGVQIYQEELNLIISIGWQPATGAVTYDVQVSYDAQASWIALPSTDTTTTQAIISGASDNLIYVRVRGRSASGVAGGWSIATAQAPDLTASKQYVTFKLTPDDFEQRISRVFDSLDLLFAAADLAAETTVLADASNELGKANVKQIAVARVDLDRAYAIFGTTVTAEYNGNGATLSDMLEALSEADQTNAQATLDVTASFGDYKAQVTQQIQASAAVSGQMVGSYVVKVAAGNYWGGLQIVTESGATGDAFTEFRISTDKFLIGPPGGGDAQAAFTVALVAGVARVAIMGDLYADGTIGAAAIQAQTLSAISADLGLVTAGQIILSGTGNNRIEIWDD